MPCYEHFVALQKSVFVPLVFFLHSHLGTRTGLYYIDFHRPCDNRASGPVWRGKVSLRVCFCRRQALISWVVSRARRRERIETKAISMKATRCSSVRSKMVFNRR